MYMTNKKNPNKDNKDIKLLIKKEVLKPFGYIKVDKLTLTQRQFALKKAVKKIKNKTIFRRLVLLSVLSRDPLPKLSKIFKRDAIWLKKKFGLKD